MDQPLGEMTLGELRFPITTATFGYVTDDGYGDPGWDFEIRTDAPVNEPSDDVDRFLFHRGLRFYAESDPIPLEPVEDLTGVLLELEPTCDPDSGEVYFTLYVSEHGDVSNVALRFVERDGTRYKIHLTALAHNIYAEPTEITAKCWIERLPDQ